MERPVIIVGTVFILGSLAVIGLGGQDTTQSSPTDQAWRENVTNETKAKATFAGGCFWCIEGAYMGVEGVHRAISGYAGGARENATYRRVATGETDHREAVRVIYYPSLVSYEELLDIFWRSIDPTDPGGQFTDRGPQYTTAIYAHDQQEYQKALESKKELNASGRYEEPIVTEITNYTTFFRAEDRHQNYSIRNKARYKAYEAASGRTDFLERIWDRVPLG